MKFEQLLLTFSEEIEKGDQQLEVIRTALFRLLKEYLRTKYKKTLPFRPGEPIDDYLYGQDFFPALVTVYNKYGTAACGTAVSVVLTDTEAIHVETDEAGDIYDAAEELLTGDLIDLCHSIVEYENMLAAIRGQMATSGEWKAYAHSLLTEHFPEAPRQTVEDFIRDHWKNLQTDDSNLKYFEQNYGR